MNFLDIPEEVIFNHVFPFLKLNDLLRLRRVNKFIKPLAEDYLQLHVTSSTSFIIENFEEPTDDYPSTLSPLLDLNYVAPLSKFHIRNIDNKSFEAEQLQQFAEIYGKKVTHLELCLLEIPIVSRKAIRFFESLPNLEHLEIHSMEERMCSSEKQKKIKAMATKNLKELAELIPSTFRRLRSLIIYSSDCFPSAPVESFELVWKFIEESSPQLELLRHPENIYDNGILPGGRFGTVQKMLEGNMAPNLKIYDIGCFLGGGTVQPVVHDFYKLVTACSRTQVKLVNVNGCLIEGMMALETRDKEDHGLKLSKVVKSIENLHQSSFLLELPHLEKIKIGPEEGTWGNCSMPDLFSFERKAWANLKNLKILIDSSDMYNSDLEWEDTNDAESSKLLNFFFVGIRREKMEKLSLTFHLHEDLEDDILPYPRIIDICYSCPNLKKLTLSEWPGTNKAISKLWGGLPLLEKVKFDGCIGLGNVAFVGEDKENPELLKAIKLRSLTLERFEMMPKITDTLFSLVLRHMPLKELNLIAYGTVSKSSKITLAGISGLRGGVFSETIEKLFLDFWMEGVTKEELKAVEKEFRSSQM